MGIINAYFNFKIRRLHHFRLHGFIWLPNCLTEKFFCFIYFLTMATIISIMKSNIMAVPEILKID